MRKITDEEFIERQTEAALGARIVCPKCGHHYVIPGTYAAERFGVCEVCWMRANAEAKESLAAFRREQERYNAAREDARRHRCNADGSV